MAWVGDPIWLADELRAWGLTVIEHDGWLDRGHGDFLDIRGVICHHTAGGGVNDWKIVQYGRSDLPGPLAQIVLERDGTVRLIAVGVCWHAGRGSHPGWPTNDANWHTIGIEAVNSGTGSQPWTPEQLDAYKRICAAILRKIGRTAKDCVAHREYSSEGKIDPWGIDMNSFRADVQRLIDEGPDELSEVSDIIKKELTYRFQSRVEGSNFRDTLVGYVLESDKKLYDLEQRVPRIEAKLDKILEALEKRPE